MRSAVSLDVSNADDDHRREEGAVRRAPLERLLSDFVRRHRISVGAIARRLGITPAGWRSAISENRKKGFNPRQLLRIFRDPYFPDVIRGVAMLEFWKRVKHRLEPVFTDEEVLQAVLVGIAPQNVFDETDA
jgi:hypothetical protein